MNVTPLRIAFTLIRVPRLFGFLLFWPLFLGLSLVSVQIIISMSYLKITNQTSTEKAAEVTDDATGGSLLRSLLFGSSDYLPELKICTWRFVSQGKEEPISTGCEIDPLDVVIHRNSVQTFDLPQYKKLFNGSTRRLHFCQQCKSDIVIEQTVDGKIISSLYSLKALGLYSLKDLISAKNSKKYTVDILKDREQKEKIEGTVMMYPEGLENSINISETPEIMLLVFNISSLIIICLWLALKSHRKVLDYFAQNNALLPLVASCGKQSFYLALWVITGLRVFLFLLATIPPSLIVYLSFFDIKKEHLVSLFNNPLEFALWLMALCVSLTAITIISSIGELKQRNIWQAALFKYIPGIICIAGSIMWIYTIFFQTTYSTSLQLITAGTPILGLSAVILAPVFGLGQNLLVVQSLLASLLVIFALRYNSRWFAAHLEEI